MAGEIDGVDLGVGYLDRGRVGVSIEFATDLQKVVSEPPEIVALLQHFGRPLKRVGLEAGPTSSWLFSALRVAGYPALCLAGLGAMRNKTDRNDARGIAHLVRLGWSVWCMSKPRGSADPDAPG